MKSRCYIGLGSNLNNPRHQVLSAIEEIRNLAHTEITAQSSLYRTSPVGPIEQDDFINAVICVETSLSPQILFELLCQIENQHQRLRNERWGPRTLDCDILLFDDLIQQTPELTLPHPRMLDRLFVLVPLQEISKNLILPNRKLISDHVSDLQMRVGDVDRLVKIASSEIFM
jgi:2-amino-4-hydroxy-6-hydroxymethyldihydropteridine diphosphokinase